MAGAYLAATWGEGREEGGEGRVLMSPEAMGTAGAQACRPLVSCWAFRLY